MILPQINPGIEERSDRFSDGVDPGQITPFVQVTGDTGQGQIVQDRSAAMFDRNDMLDLQCGQRG